MNIQTIIPFQNNQINVVFPNKCIYCGKPQETTVDINLSKTDTDTRQKGSNQVVTSKRTYTIELPIPYCLSCAARFEGYKKRRNQIAITIGLVGSLLTGLWIVFLSDMTKNPLIVLVSAAVIGVTLAQSFWDAIPLFLNKDYHTGLGIKADFTKDRHGVEVHFTNESYGKEFMQVNEMLRVQSNREVQEKIHETHLSTPATPTESNKTKIEYSYSKPFIWFLVLLALCAILFAAYAITMK